MARKMKDSGIEWIGEIPEGWEVTRLKYLADFEPTCDTSYLTDESEITYTPMECVKNGDFENRSALYGNLSHTLTPFQNGDIAMAKVTPCFENGNIAIMNNLFSGFGLGSSELFIFRPKSISTRYLFYWLQNKAFVARACSTMTGTGGLKRISPSFIRNCPVHCPSMDEQTKISDYLKAKCSEIDTMLSKNRSSIEEYKKLKQAVITQAVTKGVRGEREMKDSGVEWIGEIPVTHSIYKLKYLLRTPLKYGANESGIPYSDSLPRYIRITDITLDGNLKDTRKLSLSEESAKDYILEDGDILFARSGATVGKSFIHHQSYGRSAYAGYLIKASLNDKAFPKFVYYYTCSSLYEVWKNGIFIQSTIQNIGADRYENLPIPLPNTLQEQKEISDYLDAKCAEIDKLIAKKEQLVKELERYKRSLIYEVVTGKREV